KGFAPPTAASAPPSTLSCTTGALAVTANLQGGDTTIIAGGINFFPFKLVVRPEIKTAAELHGKKLAISRFGSASDYAAQLAIEKLGGDPKQVTMLNRNALSIEEGPKVRPGSFEKISPHR